MAMTRYERWNAGRTDTVQTYLLDGLGGAVSLHLCAVDGGGGGVMDGLGGVAHLVLHAHQEDDVIRKETQDLYTYGR